ncbi:SppA [Desulforapulum autotrophicum HRM2]|uniref:SppA n=1 Tax=Desulforapulum autotrophicum (strain ATCC 43914 / DSM 3382 / VKM B-1955 / HRM2) TaxID=177437 RepID=C0QG04_DESAH|nr:signal peptide peptidase SppA [Desulforapulum autotrophicum]ACN15572.1 SppA [Desulforapulum autotrophicum HRM2]
MFSRRHPFLFFTLSLSSIAAFALVLTVAIVMGTSAMFSSTLSTPFNTDQGNIGIVEIVGVIASSKEVSQQLKDFREDPAIKAIVLRIDSPGGGVGPSQEIYREIIKTKKIKKVIASLGSVAASGGYYAASATDAVIANPGTITGSIGVIMEYANLQKIMEKIGLTPVVIKSGEFKDMGSPVREITPKERAILQGVADEVHQQFVRDVASGRSLEQAQVEKLADGRIYTGETALDLHLVDRLGNLEDAIAWAGEMAGIKGKVNPVYPREKRLGIFKELVSTLFKQADITGAVTNYFRYVIN